MSQFVSMHDGIKMQDGVKIIHKLDFDLQFKNAGICLGDNFDKKIRELVRKIII